MYLRRLSCLFIDSIYSKYGTIRLSETTNVLAAVRQYEEYEKIHFISKSIFDFMYRPSGVGTVLELNHYDGRL